MTTESVVGFDKEFDSLNSDIAHINTRLDKINANIILLQSNVDRVTQLIYNTASNSKQSPTSTTTTSQDKSKLYAIQSEILKTLSLYYDSYQKLLDLKFKYRSEHNDFQLKTKRYLEIELKRLDPELNDISYNKVLSSLNKLSEQFTAESQSSSSMFQLSFEKDEQI